MNRLLEPTSRPRCGHGNVIAWAAVAYAFLLNAPSTLADVTISTATTESSSYTVPGNLYIISGGSLGVAGSLIVNSGSISNSGLLEGINVSGNLLVGNDIHNDTARSFLVGGSGTSVIAGELENYGTFTFGYTGTATCTAQMTLGSLNNKDNASLIFLPNATLVVTGSTLNNAGSVVFQKSNWTIASGNTLTNSGDWTLTQGTYTNRDTTINSGNILLTDGDFDNRYLVANSGVIDLNSGDYLNQDLTINTGSILLSSGTFSNTTGSSLTNDGFIGLTAGTFSNSSGGTVTNSQLITVESGDFINYGSGLVNNSGTISVESGNFRDGGGTLSGNGELYASGSVSFSTVSVLQGNPTIQAAAIDLRGAVMPGTQGTVGSMTFDAATTINGTVFFDLVTPGSPGIGSDLIQITAPHAGTISQNALFNFHVANPSPNIGDQYEIISGSISFTSRPQVVDDLPNNGLRLILRTDKDINGFAAVGNAYYALIARDEPYAQLARDNGAPSSVVSFSRYLDQTLPADDRTMGTANADLQWIRDTLDLMPNEVDVAHVLGEMAGEIYAPLAAVALQRQYFAMSQIAGRLREDIFRTSDIEQLENCSERYAMLTEPFTNIQDMVVRGWAAGYGFGGAVVTDSSSDGCTYGGGGVQVGYGYQVNERVGMGLFYDFGSFNLKNDLTDSANAYAHSFGGYLTWHREDDYFIGAAGAGLSGCNATRHIHLVNPDNEIFRTANGTLTGSQATFYAEYGRNIRWEYAVLRPYLGLMYMNFVQGAFDETGAGSLNLRLDKSSVNSLRTMMGGQLDLLRPRMSKVVWSFHGVWMHECSNEATSGDITAGLAAFPSDTFMLSRPSTGTDWAVMGVGIRSSYLCNHVRPYAKYDLIINSQQSLHAGFAGIEYVW